MKPHFMSYFTQMQCLALTEFSYMVLDNSSSEASGPRCRQLIHEGAEALKEGLALDYYLELVIGRKPMNWRSSSEEIIFSWQNG